MRLELHKVHISGLKFGAKTQVENGVLCVNKDVWKKVSDADKKLVLEIAAKWRDEERRMIRASDDELVAKIKEKGVDVRTVDTAAFRAAVRDVWKAYESVFGKDLLDLVEEAGK